MNTETAIEAKSKHDMKKMPATKISVDSLQNEATKTSKLLLTSSADHPFSIFQNEVKNRGIRNLDMNEFVVAALSQVPQTWWLEKIEELTPLEYRVNNALSNPDLRAKLSELLTPQRPN
jgi:hypothetical protein